MILISYLYGLSVIRRKGERVILSYEKAYPNAENRESLDISALGAAEKGKSVATLDS
jgi:hypothetical protein